MPMLLYSSCSPSLHFSGRPPRRRRRARSLLVVAGSPHPPPPLSVEFSEKLRRGLREAAAAPLDWWRPSPPEAAEKIVDCRYVMYQSGMFELMGLLQLQYLGGDVGVGVDRRPKLGLGFGMTVMVTVPASVLVVALHLADVAKGIALVLDHLVQAIE